MNFWDSSSLVALLVAEEQSTQLLKLYEKSDGIWAWWGNQAECLSALCRRHREGSVPQGVLEEAIERLEQLRGEWHQVEPSTAVMNSALRILRVHPLSAADALQLGAASIIAEGDARSVKFICSDQKLLDAAKKEGFR